MMIIPRLRQDDYYKVWQVFGYLSLVNSYLSTAVNPILYSLMSRRFRQAFKNLFRRRTPLALMRMSHISMLHKVDSNIRLNNLRPKYSF
ncbi:PREDICTED: uncharacterized protein LOC106106575 [Papilio polytes]|uniref:uncharacterized protein LOC106106575 n=1 Tax=Papilio polytes TaxID=76194 RepID=UPI0006764639|nr:PREDICTED: uncharacterized protein LOC106106575 [Papilio polytes]